MASRSRFESTCAFCRREGRETTLDDKWMQVQNQLVLPGQLLSCRDHLPEQQEEIQQQERLWWASRKRSMVSFS